MLVTTPCPAADVVRVAGIRWSAKQCFQAGKGKVGLDQHHVRKWDSWHRYSTLAIFAHAILRRHRRARTRPPTKTGWTLASLSVNEIRHLFAKLITTATRSISFWLHWSAWRR